MSHHICQGSTYSDHFQTGYTCISLGGTPIVFRMLNGNFFCNDFLIVRVDVPTLDGVVHITDGLLNFEEEGVTPRKPEITTAYPTSTLSTEIATQEVEETTIYEITELLPVTSTPTPSVLNVTQETTTINVTVSPPEYTVSPPAVTEYVTSPKVTELPYTEETLPSTEFTTSYVEPLETSPIPTEVIPNVTEVTEIPLTPRVPPEVTSPSTPPIELTTSIITVAPNESIPTIIEQQFTDVGYPVDVTNLKPHLPDTTLYTACIPYSSYLSSLPTNFLHHLATNNSFFVGKLYKTYYRIDFRTTFEQLT